MTQEEPEASPLQAIEDHELVNPFESEYQDLQKRPPAHLLAHEKVRIGKLHSFNALFKSVKPSYRHAASRGLWAQTASIASRVLHAAKAVGPAALLLLFFFRPASAQLLPAAIADPAISEDLEYLSQEIQTLLFQLTAISSGSALNGNITLQGNDFNSASKLVLLDASDRYPAVNGSLITDLTGSNVTGNISGNAGSITGVITESQVTNLLSDLAGGAFTSSSNTFTAIQTFNSSVTASAYFGDGSALTNLQGVANRIPYWQSAGKFTSDLGLYYSLNSLAIGPRAASNFGGSRFNISDMNGSNSATFDALNAQVARLSIIASNAQWSINSSSPIVLQSGGVAPLRVGGGTGYVQGQMFESGLSLDVSGISKFGNNAIISTITATGDFVGATNSSVTLSGNRGFFTSASSVTASAYYGYGGNLSGVATAIPADYARYSSSGTFGASQVFSSSVTASSFYGDGNGLGNLNITTGSVISGAFDDDKVQITSGGIKGGFNTAGKLVLLDGSNRLPAVDGSLITGQALAVPAFRKDDFSGSVNGSLATFTLQETPSSSSGTLVFLDGLLQAETTDYRFVVPRTIVMSTPPATGTNSFFVQYLINTSTAPAVAVLVATQTFSATNTFASTTAFVGEIDAGYLLVSSAPSQAALNVTTRNAVYDISFPKAQVYWNGGGTPAIQYSHNVTSITRVSTGVYHINFKVPFSSAFYTISCLCSDATSCIPQSQDVLFPRTAVFHALSTAGVHKDPDQYVSCIFFGRQ